MRFLPVSVMCASVNLTLGSNMTTSGYILEGILASLWAYWIVHTCVSLGFAAGRTWDKLSDHAAASHVITWTKGGYK